MGFKTNAYCKVWQVEPKTDTHTSLRISVSKKNKQTDQYEQEFGGFVSVYGAAAAAKAAKLKEGDRIQLGDVDVTNRFDRETQKNYTYFKVFSFEMADGGSPSGSDGMTYAKPPKTVDDGDVEVDDSKLPF